MDRRSHHESDYYDHGNVVVWHYHLSGHQTTVVALGVIAKRKGVSLQANLVIFMNWFVDDTVTSGHQTRAMALDYSLAAQEKNIKRNKAKNKWKQMGWETIASMTRCSSPSSKPPIGKTLHFPVITCIPCPKIYSMPPHTLAWFGPEYTWETPQTQERLAQ